MEPLKEGIEIIIPGEPIAMKRPRVARGHAYNPQYKEKKAAQKQMWVAWMDRDTITAPLYLQFTFYVSRDNKDIDNMIKWQMDVMQSIVFKNDLQVKIITAEKLKAKSGETVITVREAA